MDRRAFLKTSALTAGITAFGPGFWRAAYAEPVKAGPGPYGALQPADANGVMLPQGFNSRVVARTGQPVVPGGYVWHASPDGGAVFPQPDGGWVYTSNSETTPGGCGALRFDRTGQVVDGYRILDDTANNCAGGPTPWGTWLSCEEVGQGQVYECDVTKAGQGVLKPALGTFSHEAVAVDPVRQHLYLTEDSPFGRLYRFRPTSYPDLTAGTLEAAVVAPDNSVSWIPVPSPTAPAAPQVPAATTFNGGEGIWYDTDHVYFTTKGDNRVWGLNTAEQTLEILYDDENFSPNPPLTGVDNVTVSSAGDIYVAEDGGNLEIVLLSAEREINQFLRLIGQDGSEVTGPAFTAAGDRLYFSSQRGTTGMGSGGITYEITGPFRTSAAPAPVVPEIALPALLPIAAAGIGAVAYARSRRTSDGADETATV